MRALPGGQLAEQGLRAGVGFSRPGAEQLLDAVALADQQGAVEDARLAAQALFQGGEVEAIAVQLDLAIAAADEAQPTLLVVASAVAGTVGTQQAAAIGQLDEAGAGARRIVPITLRQAGAEGDDLPARSGSAISCPCSSSRSTAVPAMALPMGMSSSSRSSLVTTWQQVKVVFSVGP